MDVKYSFYFDVDYSSDFNNYNYDSKDIIIGEKKNVPSNSF